MSARVRSWIGLLGITLLLAGCGAGSGEGLDSSGNLLGQSQVGGGGGGNATLSLLQDTVFGNICGRCHTGGAVPGADAPINWGWPGCS